MRSWVTIAVVLAVTTGCGGERSPREQFDDEVVPVLEQSCSSAVCHGVGPDSEASGDVIDWKLFMYRVDSRGLISDTGAAYAATKRYIDTEGIDSSTLLRKPLAMAMGGLPHLGKTSFQRRDAEGYRKIRAWIAAESDGGERAEPLGPLEQLFADTVQPALVEATCFTASCHGPSAGSIPYHLDPGVNGTFSVAATRANYDVSRRMLSLGGFPEQSRLLRKSLPLGSGGTFHKGTNFDFYQHNPGGGVAAIEEWACGEREAAAGAPCKTKGEAPISGFVFVKGDASPGHVFDLDVFVPGRDVFLATVSGPKLTPASVENLTSAFHDAPVDVRDLTVSPDGTRVLFALRRSADQGHGIVELDLPTRTFRELTQAGGKLPGGGVVTDRDPSYGPDGSVWFVSTRAGTLADGGKRLDAELYSIDAGGELRRWTHTPHVERKPVFLNVGDEAGGEVAFSALREALPEQARAHSFRFPPSLQTEYHQHFGINSEPTLFHDLRELPDGRYVSVVAELETQWRSGQLAVLDRNFGPELDPGTDPSATALALYSTPRVMLAPDGPGVSYRDPAPLPEGRLLVTRLSEAASPRGRIEVLSLSERLDGSGPEVSARQVLVEDETASYSDAEPVFVNAPPRLDAPPHQEPEGEETGVFRHNGVAMVDAILGNLAPAGPKTLQEGFRFARLVEARPETPASRLPVPSGETRFGVEGASSTSLGWHGKSRVLAEIPLAEDGSFHARVPARVPFRVQLLDERRMAVGALHNRWFYVLPGQVLTQGLSPGAGLERYSGRCGSCHGAPDGDGKKPLALEDPDLISAASLTLSRFAGQAPRRPLPPHDAATGEGIEVDFVRDVQPILDAKCLSCHQGPTPAAGLTLSGTGTQWYTESYEELLAPARELVAQRAASARRSHLVEKLLGVELGAGRKLAKPGTPHPAELGAAALDSGELTTLVRWLDLGATFHGASP